MLVGLVFGILANKSWGRNLLGRSGVGWWCTNKPTKGSQNKISEKFPGFFSFGRVSKSGVPKKKADNTNFEMTLVGEGWNYR